jgi:hypothetical protein
VPERRVPVEHIVKISSVKDAVGEPGSILVNANGFKE